MFSKFRCSIQRWNISILNSQTNQDFINLILSITNFDITVCVEFVEL